MTNVNGFMQRTPGSDPGFYDWTAPDTDNDSGDRLDAEAFAVAVLATMDNLQRLSLRELDHNTRLTRWLKNGDRP